jgi:hypothetical protein
MASLVDNAHTTSGDLAEQFIIAKTIFHIGVGEVGLAVFPSSLGARFRGIVGTIVPLKSLRVICVDPGRWFV